MQPDGTSNPGDTGASPTPDGGNPQPPTQSPNGSEPDTNPGSSDGSAMVPSERLREETSKRREAEQRAEEAERQLAERNQQPQTPQAEDEDDLDPDVEKLVGKVLKKGGYVKESDLQEREAQRKYGEDVRDLTDKYAKTSVPFNPEEVRKYAKDNGINITNKASLEAAYRDMNFEKLREADRNAAIAEFQESGRNGGEKPRGSEGEPPEPQQEVRGVKNRVHAALQRSK